MARDWNHTDIYIAACLRPFNTHREGREHERDCPECQRIIHGEPEPAEEPDCEECMDVNDIRVKALRWAWSQNEEVLLPDDMIQKLAAAGIATTAKTASDLTDELDPDGTVLDFIRANPVFVETSEQRPQTQSDESN